MRDFSVPLAGRYKLIYSSSIDIVVDVGLEIDPGLRIPTTVVECGADARFIIAKRIPAEASRDTIADYWILDTSTESLVGPVDFATFARRREELAVPRNLALRNVEEYRPRRK
jgi:hypothetical protein